MPNANIGLESKIIKSNTVYEFPNLQEDNNSKNQTISEKGNLIFCEAYNKLIELLSNANPENTQINYEDNKFAFNIRANHKFGLPHGQISKLLLKIILDEIRNKKSPVIRLSKVFVNSCRANSLAKNKMESRVKQNIYDQILRLFTAEINFAYITQTEITKFKFWWNQLQIKKQNPLTNVIIIVTKDVYEGLIR